MAHRANGLNDIFEHDVTVRDRLTTKDGTIQTTPTADYDIANKKYIDDQFPVTHASTTGQGTDDHHAQSHDIASHSDTTATGTELNTLTDNSMANTLHRHSELTASNGSPDAVVQVSTGGTVTITGEQLLITSATTNQALGLVSTDSNCFIYMSDNNSTGVDSCRVGAAGNKVSLVAKEADGTLSLDTVNTPRLTIDSTGKVGIGTDSPEEKLHVSGGNILLNNTYGLWIERANGSNRRIIDLDSGDNVNIGDAGTDDITFNTPQGEAMRIKQGTGNVGIGTTSPGFRFHVNSGTTNGAMMLESTDATTTFYLKDSGTTGNTYVGVTVVSDGMRFRTGNSENVVIDSDGNVGMGVIDPHSKLEVNGAISSASLTVTASADNTNVSGVNIMWVTTSGGAVVLGGLTGGVAGQFLYVIRKDTTNDLTLENAEGAGDQDFIMHQEADEIIDAGGILMVCDGTDWYDCSHAKHV